MSRIAALPEIVITRSTVHLPRVSVSRVPRIRQEISSFPLPSCTGILVQQVLSGQMISNGIILSAGVFYPAEWQRGILVQRVLSGQMVSNGIILSVGVFYPAGEEKGTSLISARLNISDVPFSCLRRCLRR